VHINSGYLLGGTVFQAAFDLRIPTVLTLHDYWFMCPRITLLRPNGKICARPVVPESCVWCSLLEKRRYRVFDPDLVGRIGEMLFVGVNQLKGAGELLEVKPLTELIRERRQYLKNILEQVDLVLFPSRFLMQKIEEYGFSLRRKVYLPFQVQIATPTQLTASASDKLRIGYMGQLMFHKGVHLLMDAFQRLKQVNRNCELFLYGGTGEDTQYIRRLYRMARRRSDIHFMGPYPNTQVGQILSGLDGIVVPSLWYENRPTVIVEAQAMQIPAVAARIGGMAEIIRHEQNGLLFGPGNAASLATQLQRLLDEPELLPRLQAGILLEPVVGDETTELVALYQSLATKSAEREGQPLLIPRALLDR
jgi:glycosyltransferase involved in cell wall biosynthesis